MTLPSAERDRLMRVASRSLSPVARDLPTRSQPARSTRFSFPTRTAACKVTPCSQPVMPPAERSSGGAFYTIEDVLYLFCCFGRVKVQCQADKPTCCTPVLSSIPKDELLSTVTVKIEWDREESLFMAVAAVARFFFPTCQWVEIQKISYNCSDKHVVAQHRAYH